jgi:calcineurin-like phosphoesterase family protein
MLWFTADSHFGHTSILDYCQRPFGSVEEMDAALSGFEFLGR